MFKRSKARMALLVTLQEELIRKIDEQISVERAFVQKLDAFLFAEQRIERERLRMELMDKTEKEMTEGDKRF